MPLETKKIMLNSRHNPGIEQGQNMQIRQNFVYFSRRN